MTVDVVYGSSLAALRYAPSHDLHIVLESAAFPPPYTSSDIKKEWSELFVQLMLAGKTIGGDKVTGTHLKDEYIQVVSRGNVVNKVEYETLHLFSDKNIFGLPAPSREARLHKGVDLLTPRSLSTPHVHHITTGDGFVDEIFILKPQLRRKADIYAISHLEENQLHDFDYSDTMVRFKSEEVLKTHGFEGSANGKHKRLLRLESAAREIVPPMHQYEDTQRIKFLNGK